MRVNLVSDLHLNFADLVLPGGDVLVMAGDIMEAGHLRRADNAKKDTFLADRYRRFISEELSKYNKVVYICGNHEHYNNEWEDTHIRLKAELPDHVSLLESESVRIGDVDFFAGTMWTDCNKGDPLTMRVLAHNMNDYHTIKFKDGVQVNTGYGGSYWTSKLQPVHTKEVFHKTVNDLKTFLNGKEKVVVVSHHGPTHMSIDEFYKDDFHMNGGYVSDLSDLILDNPQIKYWLHGHTHQQVDYMVGETRVLCNARGYHGHERSSMNYDANFGFDI